MVAENVEVLEAVRGSVLEFDSEEVAEVWGRSSAELDGDGGSVVSCRKISRLEAEIHML